MLTKVFKKGQDRDDRLLETNLRYPSGVTNGGLGLPNLLVDELDRTEDEDSDTLSIASFSTTSTADDLPGAGNTVDKYLYRPVGSWIERALRVSHLAPDSNAGLSSYGVPEENLGARHGYEVDGFEEDTPSVSSFSTMATMDDNPGPGRTIDKHFYQTAGRKVELWAGRIAINYISPGAILNYMDQEAAFGLGISIPKSRPKSISDVMTEWDEGNAVMDGWKALVKQIQSKSVARSAVALAALIRMGVSYPHGQFTGLYLAIAENTPVLRLGEIASTLDYSNALREPLLALSRLADISCTLYGPPIEPSVSFVQTMRSNLLKILQDYQAGRIGLLAAIGDACLILATSVRCSFIHSDSAPGNNVWDPSWTDPAWIEVFNATYLVLAFSSGSLRKLCLSINPTDSSARKCHVLVLSAYAHWIDNISAGFRYPSSTYYDHSWLNAPQWVRINAGVAYLFLGTTESQLLFPRSCRAAKDICERLLYADRCDLPRRNRTAEGPSSQAIASLFTEACLHTQKLLVSVEALEQETQSAITRTTAYDSKIGATKLVSQEERRKYLWRSLRSARRAHVSENNLTAEFRTARKPRWLYLAEMGLRPVHTDEENSEVWPAQWDKYKVRCNLRHGWGVYLRSSLEWEWNLAKSLQMLFAAA